MTTTQSKSNHYDPVALEAALRKFEQEQFDASKEDILKNFIDESRDSEFNAEENDTTKRLLTRISDLIHYSREDNPSLPEEVTSKLTEILSTVPYSENYFDDDEDDLDDEEEDEEEDYFTNESEDDFVKEEVYDDDDFYDDADGNFDDDEDDFDDDDADDDDEDFDYEDEDDEDDEDDNCPSEFGDFDEFVDKYDLAPNVKRWKFNPEEPRTEGWLVFPEFVPPKPTLKPVLFEIPFTFEDYFAIGKALEDNEELSERQQKQYQTYKSLVMCLDQQVELEGDEQSFTQADFSHNSHSYLVLFGQLYKRPFLNLSRDQLVTEFHKQADELLENSAFEFVKKQLYDDRHPEFDFYIDSNWEVVTDKSLLQAFAHKPDGRYPLEFVKPVNLYALGDAKEKLKYFKQLVVNFNVKEFQTLTYYKDTYCYYHNVDVAKRTGFLRRLDAYESFIYSGSDDPGITAFLCQFEYFSDTDYRLLDLDGVHQQKYIFFKGKPLCRPQALPPLVEEETFFAECEYPWLVFNGHVFRPRLNKDETSPTKPIELEVGPKFSPIVLECSPDGVEEKLEFDFIRNDEYLPVGLLTHWGTDKLQGQDNAVINWLLKNGWVEVIDSEQIPQTSYFSRHLHKVSYVTRNYTQEDLELFKLLPNGFYKRPPFYNEAWLTDYSLEEVNYYLLDKITDRNYFRDYRGEPVGFDNDFYYRSDEPVFFAGLSKQEVLNHLTCQLISGYDRSFTYRHFEFSNNSHPYAVVNGRLYCRSLVSENDAFIHNFDSLPAEVEGAKRPYERLSSRERYNLQCRPGVNFSEEFAFAGWKQVLDYRVLDHFSGVPDGRYPVPEFRTLFPDDDEDPLFFKVFEPGIFAGWHHLNLLKKLMPRFKNNHYCLLSAQADSGVALTPQQETILSVQKRLSEIAHCLLREMKGIDEYVLFFDKSDTQRKQLKYFACPNLEELIISTNSAAKISDKDQSNAKQLHPANASATTQGNATAITQANVTTSTTTTGTGKSLASVGFSEPTFEHNRLPLLVLRGKVYRVRTEGETTPYCELRWSQLNSAMRELPDGRYSLPPGYKLGEKIPEINIKLVAVIQTLHQLINASSPVVRTSKTAELYDLLNHVKQLLDELKFKD